MAITVDLITADQRSELIELYVAYFNRAPDADGLSYWASQILNGWSTEDVARSFFEQPEVEAAYPASMTTSEFIDQVYQNVLNRTPDTDGKNYWIDALDSGLAREKFILAIIEAAKSPTGSQDDADTLANKTAAGEHFAIELGLNDVNLARIALQGNGVDDGDVGVTNDPATATDAAVDARINAIIINGDTELAAAETTTLLDIKGATSPIAISDVTADIITIDYDANTITGEDDQFIGIGEIPTTGSAAQPVLTLTQGVNNPAAIETVTLHSGAFENVADNTLGDIVVGSDLTTLKIQGGASLTVVNPLDANIAVLNAGSHTGAALNLDVTDSAVGVTYTGSQGVDTVTFEGTANNNTINLGTGDDVLTTGNGNDAIDGGAGNDLFIIDPSELDVSDTVAGGTGTDTIRITGTDDIQQTETNGVSSVEVFDLRGGGSHFVVTDNLVSGGATGLEAGAVFTVDTSSATGGHTIDLTKITNPTGFALTGNAATGDEVLINDVQVAGGLNLAFAGTGDGDVLRVVDGATISGSDFAGITDLETVLLAADSTQPQQWTLENPSAPEIIVDPTVPQNSVLDVVNAGTAVTVRTNANVAVSVDGVPVPTNTTVGNVTVISALEYTENADNLIGTAADDTFHASTPDQIQGVDIADGLAHTAGDTLVLDFALSNPAATINTQLGNPAIADIEILTFNTANNVNFIANGPFTTFNTGVGNDNITGQSVDSVYNLGDGNNTYTTADAVTDNVTTGSGDDVFIFADDAHQANDTWETGTGNDTLRYQDAAGIAVAQGSIGALIQTTGTLDAVTVNSGGAVTSIAFNDTDAADFVNNTIVVSAEVAQTGGIFYNGIDLVTGHLNATGSDGADVLLGGLTTDTLSGGAGNDRLYGANGADTLTGGDGADAFIYLNAGDGALTGIGSGSDIITDFETGIDLFTVTNTGTPGSLADTLDTDNSGTFNSGTNLNNVDLAAVELVVYDHLNNGGVTDADLVTDGFGQVLVHINNMVQLAAPGDNALIAIQGPSDTGVYFYQENTGDNIADASEIRLLAVADNALLDVNDFTLI